MTMEKYQCLMIIFIIHSTNQLTDGFVNLAGIGDIQTISNFANDALGVLKGDLSITALLTGSTTPTLDKILDTVSGISSQLDEFGAKFNAKLEENAQKTDRRFDEVNAMLNKIFVELPLAGQVNTMTRELHNYIVRVDGLYEKYQRYSENRENFNNYTIEKFIEAVTSDRQGDLDDVLTRMHRLLIPDRSSAFTDGILNVLAEQINQTDNTNCGTGISPQVRLYQVYEAIVVTETRGFIMSLFAYSLLSVFHRASFEGEMKHVKDRYLKRLDEYLKITVRAMKGLSRYVMLCDAAKYISNVDYVQLDSLYMNDASSINLKEQVADIKDNMIVTGIRFIKSAHMIAYQIRQGHLLPQGLVDNRNESWKELPELNYKSSGTSYVNNKTFYSSRDYTAAHFRLFFDITDVILPHGFLVGGIKLRKIRDVLFNRDVIILYLYAIKFDFETGKLNTKNSKWLSVYDIKDKMKLIAQKTTWKPSKLGNPTLASRNIIDSNDNEQYELQYTNIDSKDAMVVPFFDTRPVVTTNPSFALTGIGLFHRGAENYGGYFNYRILNIDLTKYIKT